MKRFKKKTIIVLIETLKNGDVIVANENDLKDKWKIPKCVFKNTYEEI